MRRLATLGALAALVLGAALGAALFATPASAQPVNVRDDNGQEVRLARPARRVIALAPNLVELAYAAGGGAALVGAVRYSDDPPAAKKLPRVGDAFALNLERIAQLKPDLVLVWQSGLPERQRVQLRALGVPLYESEIRRVDDIATTLQRLGVLFGTQPVADAAASTLMQRWQGLQARYARRAPVRVFYQLWQQPLMTINGEHLIAQAIDACGGVNVFAALPTLTPTVGWEAVVQADPQLVASARVDDDSRVPPGRWPELTQIEAVKHGHFALVPGEIARMSPSFVDGAQALCEAIDKAR
ncbi:MAG: ABC transporter substrate-binding protein [Burkholderiaceae bacterium]|nr:ABC transporter substrate-binding protein [Burkholderiaceae bacterium]